MWKCEIDDRDVGGSRGTARATAKPQIEFSRQGDNPHSSLILSYLKAYLSLKKKKSLSSETFLVPVVTFGITLLGLWGARSLSFPLFHVSGNDSLFLSYEI